MGDKKKEEFAKNRRIYDRQPTEPDSKWIAFVLYRDQDNAQRTLSAAARQYSEKHGGKFGKGMTNWFSRCCVRWRWRERCVEWDRVLDVRLREQRIKALENMQDRHMRISQSMQALGGMGLRALKKRLDEAELAGSEVISVKEILGLLDSGMKGERLNMGEPDSILENRHSVDLEKKRKVLQEIIKNPELVDGLDKVLTNANGSD